MSKFQRDLAFGRTFEDKAIAFVGGAIERPAGKCSEFDFKSDGVAYEVKSDRMSATTGNMFLEYECNQRPSGIAVSTADYWFYYVVKAQEDVYKIPVPVLKAMTGRSVSGGDGYRSRGYLIPLTELAAYQVSPCVLM